MYQEDAGKSVSREVSAGVAGVFATLVLPFTALWSRPENRPNVFEPLIAGETVKVMTDPIRLAEFSFVSSRQGGFRHSERDVWHFQDERGRNVKIPLSVADSLHVGDSVKIVTMRHRDTCEASAAKKGT